MPTVRRSPGPPWTSLSRRLAPRPPAAGRSAATRPVSNVPASKACRSSYAPFHAGC